jgi:integrase
LRRGELLALRWRNVDLDSKTLRVRESLESTKAGGVRFKTPKTRAGRRDVTVPDIVLEALREHLRQQLEQLLAIEQGIMSGGVVAFPKLADDALVFATIEGEPLSLNAVSKAWGLAAEGFGVGAVTLHGLRHTHASQLIDRGVDIVTISKRLGHASPAITMKVYAHLLQQVGRQGGGSHQCRVGRVGAGVIGVGCQFGANSGESPLSCSRGTARKALISLMWMGGRAV